MAEPDLYIEPLVGWRTWILETDQDPFPRAKWSVSVPGETDQPAGGRGDGRFLLASGGDTDWPPRERLEAHCRMGHDHRVPDVSCTCGIYAARSHPILRAMGYAAGPDHDRAPDLVGEVSMWGRVLVYDNIIRAEFAYPKRLYVPHVHWRWAAPLRALYGVPVEVQNVFTMTIEEGDR